MTYVYLHLNFNEDKNEDDIVKSIDVENSVDKVINIKIIVKCNICGSI